MVSARRRFNSVRSVALARLEASWVLVGPDDPLPGYVLGLWRNAVELHELTGAERSALMREIRKSFWCRGRNHESGKKTELRSAW